MFIAYSDMQLVTIENIEIGFSKSNIPYIAIITKVLNSSSVDSIRARYNFSKRDKEFAYNELLNLLDYYDIKLNRKNILESLNQLIGIKCLLLRTQENHERYRFSPCFD